MLSRQVNLSLVWVVLVLIFTYKLLLSLNGLYFEVTFILKSKHVIN